MTERCAVVAYSLRLEAQQKCDRMLADMEGEHPEAAEPLDRADVVSVGSPYDVVPDPAQAFHDLRTAMPNPGRRRLRRHDTPH